MIYEKLKEIREKTGMNKKEFANYLGVKYTTYNGYETGAREPASDFLILVSKRCDVSIDYIMGLINEMETLHTYQLKSYEMEFVGKYRTLDEHGKKVVDYIMDSEFERVTAINNNIALLYYPDLVSTGTGELGNDNAQSIQIPIDKFNKDADFVVKMNGIAMEPLYYEGEMLYIKKCDRINAGEIGLFTLRDGCRVIRELGNDKLIAGNSVVADIKLSPDIKCTGKIIGKME